MLLSQAIDGFIIDCKVRNLSPATIDRAYQPGLRQFCEFLEDPPVGDVRIQDLRNFVIHLQESNRFQHGNHPWMEEIEDSPLSPWTVHRNVRTIKTFFNWCFEEGLVPSNPAQRLEFPQLPDQGRADFFTEEQIEVLLKESRKVSFRNHAIVFLLLDSGIRRDELVCLTLDDVNVVSGQVTIKRGKGGKFRQVRVGNACRKVLWRYAMEFRKPLHNDVQAFFLTRSGCPLSYEAVGSLLKRLGDRVGFPVYAHKFRHTFATMFARKTPNALLLADALGHTTLKMAMWYVHLVGSDSTDRVSPMDDLLGR